MLQYVAASESCEGLVSLSTLHPLDKTVGFVEARETGKRDLVILGGGPSSSQVNRIQV